MSAWLINDCVSTLGEKTFWNCLLDWFPELDFIAGEYTPFNQLQKLISKRTDKPKYVIRNADYFPWIDFDCPVISFVQTILPNKSEVIDKSTYVVYNSEYTKKLCNQHKGIIIPIGVDFDKFTPHNSLGDDILFVGSGNKIKGVDVLIKLIKDTIYNFHLVMKDEYSFNHKRVTCYNKIDQTHLHQIMKKCRTIVCTSESETQHLSGIEAGATNLSIVAPNIGIYYQLEGKNIGYIVDDYNFKDALDYVMHNPTYPREYLLFNKLDYISCKNAWKDLIDCI